MSTEYLCLFRFLIQPGSLNNLNFWEIAVIGLEPHPEDKKNVAYDGIVLSDMGECEVSSSGEIWCDNGRIKRNFKNSSPFLIFLLT